MKLDMKSILLGIVVGFFLTMAIGWGESKPVVTIREAAHLALVKDTNDNALVIDMKTSKATWVTYPTVNPPKHTVKLQ